MVWRASIEAGAGPHSVCVCVSSLVVRAQCADCRRPWLVPFTEDVSPTMVAISAVLGALLALLFFVEQVSVLYATLARDVGCVVVTVRVLLTSLAVPQNITVMLMNKESNHLKGTSYHYDMAIIGVLSASHGHPPAPVVALVCHRDLTHVPRPYVRSLNTAGACAIFGLPVAHASLPHSVLHLQALARHGEAGDLTSSTWPCIAALKHIVALTPACVPPVQAV